MKCPSCENAYPFRSIPLYSRRMGWIIQKCQCPECLSWLRPGIIYRILCYIFLLIMIISASSLIFSSKDLEFVYWIMGANFILLFALIPLADILPYEVVRK